MREALGLVEVAGKLGAIVIADVMAKVASVHIIDIEKAKGFGWMTVKVTGDVGAVQAAVEAAVDYAKRMQLLVATKVIPRVSEDVVQVFLTPTVKEEAVVKETVAVEEPTEEVVETVEETVEEQTEETVETAKEQVKSATTTPRRTRRGKKTTN